LSLPSHRILSLAVAMPCRMLAITSVIWKMVVLWENHRKTKGKWWFNTLVNIQKTMENHNIY
jgi:hypothetical protein